MNTETECLITLVTAPSDLANVKNRLCEAIEDRGKGRILGSGLSMQLPGHALIEGVFGNIYEGVAFLKRFEKRHKKVKALEVEWTD